MVGAATSSSYSGCTNLRVGQCRQARKNPRTSGVNPDAMLEIRLPGLCSWK